MLSLLATDGPGLWRKLEELTDTLPLVAAGMREVLEPTGLRGAEGRSRAGAVAAALAHCAARGDAARWTRSARC